MDIFDENKDFYYIDLFNSTPTDKEPLLTTTRAGLEGTVRLYTTEKDKLKRCILVAPYIEPVSYSGSNMWTQGGGSIVDIALQTAQQMVKDFNQEVWNLKSDLSNIKKASVPEWIKKMAENLAGGLDAATTKLPNSDYQVYNIGQFKRAYGGTTIACPISSMSVVLFSNPQSNDFNWIGGTYINTTDKPLRYICSILMYYLLGRMSGKVLADKEKSSGTGTDSTLAVAQFAPNFINARKMESLDDVVENSFALVVGAGEKGDSELNDGSSIKGQPRVLWNVLPTQLVISPSRLLTNTDDYYYVKIDVGFEMAGYLDATDLAGQWVGTNLNVIAQQDGKAESGVGQDKPGSSS